MRHAVVIEKAEGNCSAYVPDLPGCIATGATVSEVESEIREAIAFHIEGMREDGIAIPPGASQVEYVDVELAAWRSNPSGGFADRSMSPLNLPRQ